MPEVPGLLQLVPTYTGPEGATAANVLSFAFAGGDFDQSTVDDIAQAWEDFWVLFASDEWVIDAGMQATWFDIDPPGELLALNGGSAGSDTSDPLPPACAIVVSLRTSENSRRGRGRFYLPGVPDSGVSTGGILVGSLVTDLLTDFQAFGTACFVVGFVPAVYSRTDGVQRAVSTVSVDPVLDTQRRRQNRLA
jgi:hypothetical protein